MEIERTAIDGVLVIRPRKFEDARGFFAPVFRPDGLAAAGITAIGCLALFVGAEFIADYLEPLGAFTLMEVAP